MTPAHWAGLLAVGIGLMLMLCFSLLTVSGSCVNRGAKRLFFSFLALSLFGLFLPVGCSPLALLLTACLGAPGYGMLLLLSAL